LTGATGPTDDAGATTREVCAVFGRMTTLEGAPESIDEGVRALREQVFPGAKAMDGFKGLIGLADRSTGKMMAVTLWETEEAMKASEEGADQLRVSTADATAARIALVERLEVIFDERV
jgi:heme-degrading monooxygenase HmoA